MPANSQPGTYLAALCLEQHDEMYSFFSLWALLYGMGASVDNTVEELRQTPASLPNLNALVAVSKGMRAVKLCTNKILQFLTEITRV